MILGIPKLALDGRAPQNVSEWLEVATWNLVPSAKTRVRPEIETHYAETVQTRLALGASEATAQSAALTDLGDAQAAARRFRQEYLTTEDIAALKGTKEISLRAWQWISLSFLLMLGISFFLAWTSVPALRASTLLTATIPVGGLIWADLGMTQSALSRRKLTLKSVRQISRLEMINKLIIFALNFTLLTQMLMDPAQGVIKEMLHLYLSIKMGIGILLVGLLVFSFTSVIRRDFRLRKKLAAANEDDLPPLDSTSA
jgi:hypothetical protein